MVGRRRGPRSPNAIRVYNIAGRSTMSRLQRFRFFFHTSFTPEQVEGEAESEIEHVSLLSPMDTQTGGMEGSRTYSKLNLAARTHTHAHTQLSGPPEGAWCDIQRGAGAESRRSRPSPASPHPATYAKRPAGRRPALLPPLAGGGAEWSWEAAAGPGAADPFREDWQHWGDSEGRSKGTGPKSRVGSWGGQPTIEEQGVSDPEPH
jgi:hypothetical protein